MQTNMEGVISKTHKTIWVFKHLQRYYQKVEDKTYLAIICYGKLQCISLSSHIRGSYHGDLYIPF